MNRLKITPRESATSGEAAFLETHIPVYIVLSLGNWNSIRAEKDLPTSRSASSCFNQTWWFAWAFFSVCWSSGMVGVYIVLQNG